MATRRRPRAPSTRALILADCGPTIGLGHLRRSLVLGRALTAARIACKVATPSDGEGDLIVADGLAPASWPVSVAELPRVEFLIVDSYRIDIGLVRAARARAAVRMVIDDLADRALSADLVLNHNLFAETLDYGPIADCPILLGPGYALVDPAFHARNRPPSQSPRALLSFGGSDDGSLGLRAARSLRAAGFEGPIDLPISPLRSPPTSVGTGASEMPGVTLHRGGGAMPALMARATFYVGGAGTTVLEAAAAGLAMLPIAIAENQHANIVALRQRGIPALASFDDETLAEAARGLLADPEGAVLRETVASDGPARVVERLIARLDDLACPARAGAPFAEENRHD